MHTPKHFLQQDEEQLKALVRDYPFATMITHSSEGLDATHVPFVWAKSDGYDVLQGHVARVNPVWKSTQIEAEALLVFNGPNCYVSPNYYPTKLEHGRAVPTWNYLVVHIRGALRFVHDAAWNLAMLDRLTQQHEQAQPTPWSTADAPENYLQGMLRGIVGVEVNITSMQGQWKVSQNQPAVNQQGVVAGLSQTPGDAQAKMADLVGQYLTSSHN